MVKTQVRTLLAAALSIAMLFAMTAIAIADDLGNNVNTLVNGAANIVTMTEGDPDTTVTITLLATGGHGELDPIPPCNLNGASHTLVVDVATSDATVATVDPTQLTFTDCVAKTVDVTAVGEGTADISFTINEAASNAINPSQFLFAADFGVVVLAGGGGGDGVCDGTAEDTDCVAVEVCPHPAAPAWAAHILKYNTVKPKKGKPQPADNYIAKIAAEMGTTTDFYGIAKETHPDYEAKVLDRLKAITSDTTLRMPADPPAFQCYTEYVAPTA